jgi:glycosyltransferase involved in cell wall biosynthesis
MAIRTSTTAELPSFDLPIVIPVFNGVTYLSNTIDFFKARGFDEYLILNNGSEYPPLAEYLSKVPDGVTVLDLPHNPGPRVYFNDPGIYSKLPEKFILTDPDLGFKDELDREAILHLFELCEEHKRYKTGCALEINIDEPHVLDVPVMWHGRWTTVRAVESNYWKHWIGASKYLDAIFSAPIDTTFVACDKRYFTGNTFQANCRVAGRYTAIHYGWYAVPPIPENEYLFYKYKVGASEVKCSSTEMVKTGENWTY